MMDALEAGVHPDIHTHRKPGVGALVRLTRPWPELRSSNAVLLALVLDALDALRPVMQFLSAEVLFDCYENEFALAMEQELDPLSWFLTTTQPLPPETELRPILLHARPSSAPLLTRQALGDWVLDAVSQQGDVCQNDLLYWSALWFGATRARIVNEARAARDFLVLDTFHNTLDVPLEKSDGLIWVSGPLKNAPFKPPFDIKIENNPLIPEISLSLTTIWTLWQDKTTPEYALLRACIENALAQGWQITHGAEFMEPLAQEKN